MCGIVGFTGRENKELLYQMAQKIKHRGPDDSAEYFEENINIAFRRLSIVDLSNGNHQNFIVAHLEGNDVFIDGNHPFAGQTLRFSVEVQSIREATQEELSHGHVHGPGGHAH